MARWFDDPIQEWPDSDGCQFPTWYLTHPRLALFHTMGDIMTVILRIDGSSILSPIHQPRIAFASLSDLGSMRVRIVPIRLGLKTVWHTGCPTYGCEGLRVLGTRQNT